MTDRFEILDLINAYAHCADNREAQKQAELFTENAVVKIYFNKDEQPQIRHGRKELQQAFETLKQYDITTHFNGQNTITINGNSAKGEVYCLAHHIKKSEKSLLLMSIRYYDTYTKENGKWLFSERNLFVDWTDKRTIN